MNVLIADDHRLFRQGLIGLMNTRPDLVHVVGEAGTGREAILFVERHHPDVVLMDLQMPDGDGLHAAAQIQQRWSDVRVVILTASESDEQLYRAVRQGVAGYLLKSLDAAELFDLLGGVAQGEVAMTRAMAARLLKGIAHHNADANTGEQALTEREIQVLRLVAQGESNPQIAENLCITVNTVKVHLRNILAKLRLENRTQVATYAVQSGLAFSPTPQNHPTG
ncbi:MAG: response regulator transcription factor [Chloroflexi bacterium]|nr:response regulator transcription factor [Chloroflexota bacterium]